MKKIIFLLFALSFTVALNAQNVLPRFTTATYGRTVGAKLNAYVAVVDTAGAVPKGCKNNRKADSSRFNRV